jgi:pimeloyl-ACP methyl ester carboxylesterase
MMKQVEAAGVKVSYGDLGQGEPALLLMPAWCMSHHGFAELPRKLATKRRVLAIDWPGHGQSETPKGDFGWQALTETAQAVLEASGARQAVPVTLSHSGWAAIELRRRLGPERIPKIVHLDWIMLAPPPFYMEIVRALSQPDTWQATRDQLFGMWLEGVDQPDLIRFVREEMGGYSADMWLRSGREIGECYRLGEYPLKASSTLNPPAPTLHIFAQSAMPGFLEGQQEFAAANPWFHVKQLDASSHFPTYEQPDEIAAIIERFVTTGGTA